MVIHVLCSPIWSLVLIYDMRRYPVFIDAVIQSSGIGLIGMHGSTMSLLAGRRVQDWYKGVYKDVRWGTPNADDH